LKPKNPLSKEICPTKVCEPSYCCTWSNEFNKKIDEDENTKHVDF